MKLRRNKELESIRSSSSQAQRVAFLLQNQMQQNHKLARKSSRNYDQTVRTTKDRQPLADSVTWDTLGISSSGIQLAHPWKKIFPTYRRQRKFGISPHFWGFSAWNLWSRKLANQRSSICACERLSILTARCTFLDLVLSVLTFWHGLWAEVGWWEASWGRRDFPCPISELNSWSPETNDQSNLFQIKPARMISISLIKGSWKRI